MKRPDESRFSKDAGGRSIWLPALFCLFVAAGCSKTASREDATYGEPVGIEINQTFTVAVAAEQGHDLDTAVVPELATALSSAAKGCPELRDHLEGGKVVSLHMVAKDGVLSATPDPLDPSSTCLAHGLDGKRAPKLGTAKLFLQVGVKDTPKEAK